jgi:integrase
VASTKIAGTYIEVPLHPHVQAIRDRWQGWPPAISDQRFNDYVKELCKLAGMNEKMHGELAKVITKDGKRTKRNVAGKYAKWELISSHTCRRSFATNFYGVLPTGDIMHVTGHSSEAQLMEYIHAKPIDTRRRVRAAMDTL